MTLYFPPETRSDYMGYSTLIRLHHRLNGITDPDIMLDFSDVTWIK